MRRLLVLGLLLPGLALGQTTRVLPSNSYQSACVHNAASMSCTLNMAGKSTAGVVVTASSSPSGITLTPQVSMASDCADTTFVATWFEDQNGTRTATLTNTDVSSPPVTRSIVVPGGTQCVRVKNTAWTSGSVTLTVSGTDTLSTADLNLGAVTTSAPTYTTGTVAPLSLDTSGGLRTSGTLSSLPGSGAFSASAPSQGILGGVAATSSVPSLTNGYMYGLAADLQGRLLVRTDHMSPFVCRGSGVTTLANLTCTPSAPSGSGVYYYVTGAVISNGPTAQTSKVITSTTTACGGSPTDVTSTIYLGVNSGAVLDFRTPIKAGAANSYMCCQGSGNTAQSCTVTGYLAP